MSKIINRISLRPILIGLLLSLVYPLTAQADVSWVVHGRGFGHGVGMSAYGAYGYAKQGKGYRFILGHYYRGTTIGTLTEPHLVRVLLEISSGDVGFSGATSACGTALDPAREYQAHRVARTVKLRSSAGKPLADGGGRLRAAGASTRGAATRPTATAARCGCARAAARRSPTAGGGCGRPGAARSQSPAMGPTAARWRRCRPKARRAR